MEGDSASERQADARRGFDCGAELSATPGGGGGGGDGGGRNQLLRVDSYVTFPLVPDVLCVSPHVLVSRMVRDTLPPGS